MYVCYPRLYQAHMPVPSCLLAVATVINMLNSASLTSLTRRKLWSSVAPLNTHRHAHTHTHKHTRTHTVMHTYTPHRLHTFSRLIDLLLLWAFTHRSLKQTHLVSLECESAKCCLYWRSKGDGRAGGEGGGEGWSHGEIWRQGGTVVLQ